MVMYGAQTTLPILFSVILSDLHVAPAVGNMLNTYYT
jgi:hypothetical protein